MTKHMQCLPNNTIQAFWSKGLRNAEKQKGKESRSRGTQVLNPDNVWNNIAFVCKERKLKIA